MFGRPGRMVLIEKKGENPRYSLTYRRDVSKKTSQKLSYDIISCLVKERDLLLEIDSSLFAGLSSGNKDRIFEELVVKLREKNLDYKYRRNSYPKKTKVFGIAISSSQKDTEHELLVYIPNRIWATDQGWDILPEYGVTYHLLDRGTDGPQLLEDIHAGRLMEKEIREHYETTIFDCFNFGLMGIDTDLSKGEIEDCLKDLNRD